MAEHLAQCGHDVLLGSRRDRVRPAWLPQAGTVRLDWDNALELKKSCEGADIIIHAAGMNAQDCAADPAAAMNFNGVVTKRFAQAASQVAVKKFIYMSTAHVYCSPLRGRLTEKSPLRNSHPYALSNVAGESAVLETIRDSGLKGGILRVSNAYGYPTHGEVDCWKLAVQDLCFKASQTGRLILKTSGTQQRDFVSIKKVCRVIEFLIASPGEVGPSFVLNVGSGVSQSILEVAGLIQRRSSALLGFQPSVEYNHGGAAAQKTELSYRSDFLERCGPSTSVAEELEEIDELIKFCKKIARKN